MSIDPKISIVIPVYNREQLVARAIASVLKQSFTDFEIIAVDDASADKSVEVVEEIAREDLRVRSVVLHRNQGAQAARNAGIRAARGQWIAFLDSDDEWLPDSLDVRFRAAVREGKKVIHSDCLKIAARGEQPTRWALPPLEGWVYVDLLKKPGPMFQGLLVAKEALERIQYLDDSIRSWQEWDTSIRLAEHFEFTFVPEPTYVWHFDHGGSMSDDKGNSARGYEQVFKKHRRAILRHAGLRALCRHYYVSCRWYLAAGEIRQALLCWGR